MTTSDTPVTIRPLQAADWPAVWPILRTTFQAGDTYAFAPDSTEAEIHKAWVELPAATFVALGAGGEILGAKNVFAIFSGPRKYLAGMGRKAWCAVDSPAIHKRRNAADRPARHLPEGLGRNRAIGRLDCLHGHEPMRRIRSIHSSRLRPNAAPKRSQTRSYFIKPNQPGQGAHVCNCGYVVAPVAQGQGVASLMCEHSQQQAVAMGFRAMQFNLVVASNVRAVRLWQHLGFAIVGTPVSYTHLTLPTNREV